MKTVTEMAKCTGVSVRTLHHYDAIGLLRPTVVTESGYRLYDDGALERLYLILLFREIGFSLKQIRGILDAPDYDRNRVLERQVELLQEKIAHLQDCIHMARGIELLGTQNLDLEGFHMSKKDKYYDRAKTLYGKTDAWKQWEEKSGNRTEAQEKTVNAGVMDFFVRLGAMKDQAPDSEAVQNWVRELQAYFTENFYDCTPQILLGLARMYADGGSMTENIDAAGGKGTGAFAGEAIRVYCGE